jgi:monofunctional biosynthetic peptidoglycan transglycosylase
MAQMSSTFSGVEAQLDSAAVINAVTNSAAERAPIFVLVVVVIAYLPPGPEIPATSSGIVQCRAMVRRKKKSKPRKRKVKRRSIVQRLARVAALALLAVLVLSVLLVLPLRWFNPMTTAFMLQDDFDGALQHEWVAWQDIGIAPKLAVVASEDQRFADHFGVDVSAIQKAVLEQDERGSLRGASTITQQTAKNLYLWSGRSFVRKGLEAWLSVVIEICLSKQRILEIYLNVAEMGPGIYGVGEASRYYFDRTPADVSNGQAALLAAVLPNPVQLRVSDPSEYVRERKSWILKNMQRLQREGWITRIE